MTITLSALQKQRRDTASNWTSNNTVLLAGEWGIESDTKKFKIGDGTTAWQSLDYVPIPDTNRLLTGNLTVGGNFTVNGTTTTIDTTTLTVEDKNIEIGKVSSPSDTTADGGGITLKGTTDKTINWVDSTDSWTLSEHLDFASGKVLKVAGTQILSATALGSSVVSSSLTSLGTIATGVWQGTAIGSAYMTAGSTTAVGAVQLTDSTTSTSTTTAATPNSVKTTKDVADAAQTTANAALPKAGGDMTGNIVLDNDKEVRFNEADSNGSAYVGIKGATDKGSESSYTISLPAGAPTANQILKADASTPTTLTWATDSGGIPTSGGSFTGDVTLANQSDARFAEATANGSNYVGFQAPATVASNLLWTLPATDASVSGHALVSDASGTLSWAEAGGGGGTGGGSEQIFFESENAMDSDYTITANHNALVAGPLTINATLTINSPSVVTIP